MTTRECGWVCPSDARFVGLASKCRFAEELSKEGPCRRLPGAHAILCAWRLGGNSTVGGTSAARRRAGTGVTLPGTIQQGAAVDAVLCAAVRLTGSGDARGPEEIAASAAALEAVRHPQVRMRHRAGVAAGAALRLLFDRCLTPVATQVPPPGSAFGVCPIADMLCIDRGGKVHIVELKFGGSAALCRGSHHQAHLSQLAMQSCCAAVCGFGSVPATRCHLLVVASLRPDGAKAIARMVTLPARVLKNVKALLRDKH